MRWMWSGTFLAAAAKHDSGTGTGFFDQTTTMSLKETLITM